MYIVGKMRNSVLRWSLCWSVILTCHLSGCVLAANDASEPLLPEARYDDGARYEILRHNTSYPEEPDFGAAIDRYDYRPWFRSLLNVDALPQNWESRLARARSWAYIVDWRGKGKPLDSLLLRFTTDSRAVQITDNRSNLILAVRMQEGRLSLAKPEETVRALCRDYLAHEVSETWRLTIVPVEGRPELLRGFLAGPDRSALHMPAAGGASFHIGPSFAVFGFGKLYPGSAPRWGINRPLFTAEAEKALPAEVATVRRLLADGEWAPVALAAALRRLEEHLPRDPGQLQAMAANQPFETEAITGALGDGYEAFVTRLEGMREGDPLGYEVIANALAACPSSVSEMQRYSSRLLRAAADAAHRLQDARLAPLLLEEIRHEKNPGILKALIEALCAILKEDSASVLLPLIRSADTRDGQGAATVAAMLRYLSKYPTEAVVAEAETLFRGADDVELRKAALGLIAEAARDGNAEQATAWREIVRKAAAEDPAPQVRLLAVKHLEQLGGASLLPDLARALGDANPEVRFAAARWYAIVSRWDYPAAVPSADEKEQFVADVLKRAGREGDPQAGKQGAGTE